VGNDAEWEICYFGFNPAVILSKDIQIDDKIWIKLNLKKCISIFVKEIFFTENRQDNSDLENWYGNSFFNNVLLKSSNKKSFIDFANPKRWILDWISVK
jgi:hypothetical protein